MESRGLSLTDDELRQRLDALGFITGSDTLTANLRQAYKAACVTDITVLVEGETGTGKQALAFAIHQLDQKRSAFPFVTMHCGSLSETLAESELFGHQKGAFTGAAEHRKGLFQSAHCGTLFLDDVNDLPRHLQAKLLDVVQRGMVRPMGSDEERRVDTRIIVASNQPLKELVDQGHWRADLYHRLNVVRLWIPPLRQRMQDLPSLLLALAHRHRDIYEPIDNVEGELVSLLSSQHFPGNVRELENCVQRMLFLKTTGRSLALADWRRCLPKAEAEESAGLLEMAAAQIWRAISLNGVSYGQALRHIERSVLKAALRVGGRTRRQVALSLQTSERTLYQKIRTHHLADRQ